MTAFLLGLAAAAVLIAALYLIVWSRWKIRDRRRRRARLAERERQRPELEEAERRLRLGIGPVDLTELVGRVQPDAAEEAVDLAGYEEVG